MSIVLSTAQFKYLYWTTSIISRVNLKWTANLLHLNTLFTQNMINAGSNFHRTLAHYLNRSSQLIERLVFVYMERVIKPPLTSLNKTQLLDRHFLFFFTFVVPSVALVIVEQNYTVYILWSFIKLSVTWKKSMVEEQYTIFQYQENKTKWKTNINFHCDFLWVTRALIFGFFIGPTYYLEERKVYIDQFCCNILLLMTQHYLI